MILILKADDDLYAHTKAGTKAVWLIPDFSSNREKTYQVIFKRGNIIWQYKEYSDGHIND